MNVPVAAFQLSLMRVFEDFVAVKVLGALGARFSETLSNVVVLSSPLLLASTARPTYTVEFMPIDVEPSSVQEVPLLE